MVLIPQPLLEHSSPLQQRLILWHELTHIQRRDYAWTILRHVVVSMYWFHPLAWWIGRQFSVTQEDVCDAACVEEFGRQCYAETLVSVAQAIQRPGQITLGLAMPRASRLAQRLVRLQRQVGVQITPMTRKKWACSWGLAALLAGLALLVEPVRAEPAPAAATGADAVNGAAGSRSSDPGVSPTSGADSVIATPDTPAVPGPRVWIQLRASDAARLPLVSTAVRIRRMRGVNPFPEFDPQPMSAMSDTQGRVTIPLNDVAADLESVALEIQTGESAPEIGTFQVLRGPAVKDPATVTLSPALHLVTRVFDAAGQPVTDANVSILADVEREDSGLWRAYRRSEADGRIELTVPRGVSFGFIVATDRGAPYRLACPAGTEQLSEIHLARGCQVSGQLLDRNGKPVADCNVVLEGEDSQAVRTELEVQRHGSGTLELSFQRTTDANGRFQFPPMVGPVRVYLDCNAATKPPQVVIPIAVTLPDTGDKWLPLMLAPTGQITGTVRWPDGKPVPKLELELLVPPNLSNSYINLTSTRTDSLGRYTLDVPFPLESAVVTGYGARGPDDKYWEVQPVQSPGPQRNRRWQYLERYLGETQTVDWVMVQRDEKQSAASAGLEAVAPEWQPLAGLEMEIEAALEAYRQAPAGPEREQLAPSTKMVARCLEFESQHRGNRQAIGALHYVMRVAAMSGSDRGIREARLNAIRILDEHYLTHPDVDLLINEFDAGSGVAEAEPLLTHLAERSPFDYVRAAALFELAQLRFERLYLAENIYNRPLPSEADYESMVKIQTSESSREWVRSQRADAVRFHESMKGVDLAVLRQSAIELLDRVSNNYSSVRTPRRQWENTRGRHDQFELKLVDSSATWRIRTIPERAEILRFQQTRLRIGMPAPEIEGLDFHQRPARLSQYRGQVVLLSVGVKTSARDLCAKCQEVVQQLKGQPFTSLSVVSGSADGGWSVRAIVEEGQIKWPIIRDTGEDDIAARWCQQTFPEVYIIDQQGIIRHHTLGNYISADALTGLVQQFLQK